MGRNLTLRESTKNFSMNEAYVIDDCTPIENMVALKLRSP
jgi:hypothetical protein